MGIGWFESLTLSNDILWRNAIAIDLTSTHTIELKNHHIEIVKVFNICYSRNAGNITKTSTSFPYEFHILTKGEHHQCMEFEAY